VSGVGELIYMQVLFHSGPGQQASSEIGVFDSNHDPLRAPRRETDAELWTVYSRCLQHAGNTLALEQALDHLRLDSMGANMTLTRSIPAGPFDSALFVMVPLVIALNYLDKLIEL
jgi:hypothetical protein